MSKPSTSDFLTAADAAYSGDPAGTSEMTVLTGAKGAPVQATKAADGFHGVALETASGQVIISFEGTALGSLQSRPTFVQAQLAGDAAIATGQDPAAYADALRFANLYPAVKVSSVYSFWTFETVSALGFFTTKQAKEGDCSVWDSISKSIERHLPSLSL